MKVVTFFLVAVLAVAVTTANVAASTCSQTADVATGRYRAPPKQRNHAVAPQGEERCGDYSSRFFEAVKVRQTVATCDDGRDHQRDLDVLDAHIDDLNNLIAAQCRGS